MQNLYELLMGNDARERSRVCVETESGETFSYSALDEHSARMANLLVSCGIAPGDRVAVQVEKSPHAVFLYLACLRTGAVYLPINTVYTSEETDYFLADAQPKVMVCQPDRWEEISGLCRRLIPG